jgi:hypothetical protein
MGSPQSYYVQRAGIQEGPLSAVQINRMKQRRLIAADTPCRAVDESTFRRLDEVLPHLKEYQGVSPQKMTKLKQDIETYEIRSLTVGAFGGGALFWAPMGFGFLGALSAVVFGVVLVFKHRKPIGFAAVGFGLLGLSLRFYRIWLRMH